MGQKKNYVEKEELMNHFKMKKKRSSTYLKSQRNKAVKYYFINPDTTLKCLAEKFRVNQDKLSKDISQKLEQRFKNSISQKYKK